VINDQTGGGRVTGLRASARVPWSPTRPTSSSTAPGRCRCYQDKADFGDHLRHQRPVLQFCSAYREIVEVPESRDDAVFKATDRAAGYLWYFPRTATEINAGLGFQMNEEPMQLVEALKRDLRNRPEFEGARSKTSSAPRSHPPPVRLGGRAGYMAVGAAGHVNPDHRGGIAGAAYAGKYAGEQAVLSPTASERGEPLAYNTRVMDHFGGRYAGLDVYNVLSTAVDVDDLMGLLASLPGEKAEALYEGRPRCPSA